MFRKILILLVTSLLIATYGLLITHTFAQEEKLTITTYYPSPYGSYYELRAYKLAVGNPNDTAYYGPRFVNAADNMGIGEILASTAINISGRYYGTRIAEKVISADPRSGTDIMSDLSVNILLDADANNSTTASFRILNATADSSDNSKELFRVNANGNVGIGAADPQSRLHITGATPSGAAILIQSDLGHLRFHNSGNNVKGILQWAEANDSLLFYAGGASSDDIKMRIHANGSVGIGTTDIFGGVHIKKSGQALTLETLDVNDSFDIQFYDADDLSGAYKWDLSYRGNTDPGDGSGPNALKLFTSGAGGTVMTWRYDGNVGIGTVSPQAKLDVNGRVRLQSVSAAVPGEAGNLAWFNGGACSNIGELHVRDNGVNAVLCFCGRRGGGGTLYCW